MKTRMILAEVSSVGPITITTLYDWEIEDIIDYKAQQKQRQKAIVMLVLHWKGQSWVKATREWCEDLWQFKNKIREFMQ